MDITIQSEFITRLYSLIQDNLPDNESQEISAEMLREVVYRISDTIFANSLIKVNSLVNEPPSPVYNGDTFLVGTNPSGDFTGKSGKVARFNESMEWEFLSPINGMSVFTKDGKHWYFYQSPIWKDVFSTILKSDSDISFTGNVSFSKSPTTSDTQFGNNSLLPKSEIASLINSAISAHNSNQLSHDDIRLVISTIQSMIPSQASDENQLADKDFVNSTINSLAAFFRGSFATHEDLENYSGPISNNDYAYVEEDETHQGQAWRYIYVESDDPTISGWYPQFKVNDTPLTAAQLAALNSGATVNLINKISANAAAILLKQDILSAGNGISATDLVSKSIAILLNPNLLNGLTLDSNGLGLNLAHSETEETDDGEVTTYFPGAMSANDKEKLDGIDKNDYYKISNLLSESPNPSQALRNLVSTHDSETSWVNAFIGFSDRGNSFMQLVAILHGSTNVKYSGAYINNGTGNNANLGMYAFSEGSGTKASGMGSHAEGGGTQAMGSYSHTEGNGTRVTDNAEGGHAEGGGTTSSGSYSHAEGGGSTASGNNSHAEGSGTIASGAASHAEGGGGTKADALCAHAEGSGTIASGPFSHAEGNDTVASGTASHAEGGSSTASGEYSHAEGTTLASGFNSHSSGGNPSNRGSNRPTASGGSSFCHCESTTNVVAESAAQDSVIIGGAGNRVESTGIRSSIVGGYENSVEGINSAIIGGANNSVTANNSVILGGSNIEATRDNTTYIDDIQVKGRYSEEILNKVEISAVNSILLPNREYNLSAGIADFSGYTLGAVTDNSYSNVYFGRVKVTTEATLPDICTWLGDHEDGEIILNEVYEFNIMNGVGYIVKIS